MDTSQILPNLCVGSYRRTTEDIDRIQRNFGFTAVLNLQTDRDIVSFGLDWGQLQAHYGKTGSEIRRVAVLDFDRDDLRKQLPQCIAAMGELLQMGHNVFVHSNMGVIRSPSAAVAYLCWIQEWDLKQAVDYMMQRRSCDPDVDAIRLAGQDRAG